MEPLFRFTSFIVGSYSYFSYKYFGYTTSLYTLKNLQLNFLVVCIPPMNEGAAFLILDINLRILYKI